MGRFLNSNLPLESYRMIRNAAYFVDKSALLAELFSAFGAAERFYCITRPRRFGKSVMANMIAAFLERTGNAKELFDGLEISSYEGYRKHLNQHNVIYLDFSDVPRNCRNYQQYIDEIQDSINRDLSESYPELELSIEQSVWHNFIQIFQKTGDKFVFVMDEWDAVFHMSFMTEANRDEYLIFLKQLLKGRVYVEFAYMTGVLPISKYSDGSELNMFIEYNMATSIRFSEYFGFLDEEVDQLFEKFSILKKNQQLTGSRTEPVITPTEGATISAESARTPMEAVSIPAESVRTSVEPAIISAEPGKRSLSAPAVTREGLREWYDGYYTAGGRRLYNPRSVVCALTDNQLSNYWVSSGKYDSIFSYIRHNVAEVQEDLALMFAGEAIPADIQEYAATSMQLETRDEIYSAMVVYGLLTYRNGCVLIPNKELMDSYAAMLKKEKSLGYLHRLASASRKMLTP